MKNTLKLIITLSMICVIAGLLLSGADALTRDRIQAVQQARKLNALETVLPPHDNAPGLDTVEITHQGHPWTFHMARLEGKFVGTAVETASSAGYGGNIRLILGIDADGGTTGIAILEQKETPGLGAKIESATFREKLVGLPLQDTDWRVRKDGGDIDHITAATISSRAVVAAIQQAVEAYLAHQKTLQTAEH